jgi:CRP-like cAMP-binding protein
VEGAAVKKAIEAGRAALLHAGWLQTTPSDFSDRLLGNCHWRRLAAGTGIQHAGDRGQCITGLASGSISMATSMAVPDSAMVHIAHPGFWFGYVPLFTRSELSSSVVARSDVLLACISISHIDQMLAERPDWWRHFGMLATMEGNIAISVAADLTIRDSRRRCAALLLRAADRRFDDSSTSDAADAPLVQEELAAITNLSRTSVSKILLDLEKLHLIAIGYGHITITEPCQLRALVDAG